MKLSHLVAFDVGILAISLLGTQEPFRIIAGMFMVLLLFHTYFFIRFKNVDLEELEHKLHLEDRFWLLLAWKLQVAWILPFGIFLGRNVIPMVFTEGKQVYS